MTAAHAFPTSRQPEGLYDPAFEHDACGVAFVATLTGVPSHEIVRQGLIALRNLDHRGATGSDPKTGDGAGILLQVPDAFLRDEVDFALPRHGAYAVGNAFLPTDPEAATEAKARIEQIAADFGVHPMTLWKWLRQADIDDGATPGKTTGESTELRELRRRNRLLEQENEVLRRAAAYLSQSNLPGKGFTRS